MMDVAQFADWLSRTSLSVAIQSHEWIIPTIQSLHIAAIGVVMASVFMIDLRVLGLAGRDQSLLETTGRFGPWLSGALCVLLTTGVFMIIGEPGRELLAFSFWLKMLLIAIGTLIASIFQIALKRNEAYWEKSLNRGAVKSLAILTFLIWVAIVILGRLIAYDHVWGSWSLSPKA
jgi:energy-coupling factor transporter transmembrane protein EcfT